jgi:hypothetical protein
MRRYVPFVFVILFVFVVLGAPLYVEAAPIVIDHTRTNINELSQADIVNAKNDLHIAYGHTSHGSQVTSGMSDLVGFANGHGRNLNLPTNIFAWNNGGTGGALDLHDYAMGGDVGYYPDWVDNTHGYLGAVNPTTGRGSANADVNVIIWSWCGQAAGYSELQMINQYLTPMTSLENEYWGVKFVYMTCHLDGTGVSGNLNQRNNQIRTYCQTNNKILYDFADIESYDPDGLTNYMPLMCNDNCYYDSDGNGSLDKNWAIDWQSSHTINEDWYYCDTAHSQSLNGNLKAYAAWALWTDIATPIWNGPGGGTFGSASSWTNNTVPNGVDAIANFTENITAPSDVVMTSPVTLGSIKFKSTQSYNLTGTAVLTLQTSSGDATINVIAGSHSIDVPVVINSDTVVMGEGTVDLSEGISGNHALTVLGNLDAASIQVNSLTIGVGAKVTINPIAGGSLGGPISPVPEPSAIALLGMCALALIPWLRRRFANHIRFLRE